MKLAVAGDSAGEGLARVLADYLKDRHEVSEVSRTETGPDPVFAAALLSMLLYRMKPAAVGAAFRRTFVQMKIPIPTIALIPPRRPREPRTPPRGPTAPRVSTPARRSPATERRRGSTRSSRAVKRLGLWYASTMAMVWPVPSSERLLIP